MAIPPPTPGLVISYAYLWRREHRSGREEGRKERPCVIVLAVHKGKGNAPLVTVAPVTHSPPIRSAAAIELPYPIKVCLGLDEARSWVIVEEVNRFAWPGYDIRLVPGENRYDYGMIPPRLYDRIVARLIEEVAVQRVSIVPRD